ncbi:MAG: transposase, partial [Cyclobacteriaceae bacterium]
MIKRGIKKREVASILGVHANTITNWVKKKTFKAIRGSLGRNGVLSLKTRNCFRPSKNNKYK